MSQQQPAVTRVPLAPPDEVHIHTFADDEPRALCGIPRPRAAAPGAPSPAVSWPRCPLCDYQLDIELGMQW